MRRIVRHAFGAALSGAALGIPVTALMLNAALMHNSQGEFIGEHGPDLPYVGLIALSWLIPGMLLGGSVYGAVVVARRLVRG